jgi:small redox-active disulfide protein 2
MYSEVKVKSVKVLGPGCKKCKQLEQNVRDAASKLSGEFNIEKIEDYQVMGQYGMLATPGLVIDEKLISTGKVYSIEELIEILK